MKRIFRLLMLGVLFSFTLSACGKKDEEVVEEVDDTTEQVAIDGTEVEDYNVLSYSELEVLAYEDDTDAQVMLGRMLEYGTEDVKQDFAEAISWYQMASDSGNVDGTCALGYFYLTGTGVDQDLEKAAELFDLAIEGGSVNANVGKARVMLAQLTDEELAEVCIPAVDIETESEETESADSETADAESTDTESQDTSSEEIESSNEDSNLQESDESLESDEDTESDSDTEDSATEEELSELEQTVNDIYDLFYKAQISGDLDGTYYLGYAYEHGIGVTGDYKKAFDYYSRAAKSESTDLGDQYAINLSNTAIGLLYVNGHGVETDVEQAIEYFTAASDNGYAKASYYLGQIYEKGLDVDRDYELAMEYYLIAADADFAPALNQIGYMYYNGYGVDSDFASAVYYQKLAALQGYAIAQINLGFLYENGYGVERNLETALSYYEMAAESGYEGAMEAVVRVKAQINEEM